MTFEATVVTLILLSGLWLLYRLTKAEMRVGTEQDSTHASNVHTPVNTAQSGYKGFRWIERVPKIFTQPHIITGSKSENPEYQYQTGTAESNTQTQQIHSAQATQMFVRPNEQDNLKLIKGIGKVMEKTLNDLGITTFKQLANFQPSDVQSVSDALSEFPGRIERDNWVGQARDIYHA